MEVKEVKAVEPRGAARLPGKNCGLCGEARCADLARKAKQGLKRWSDCPFAEVGPSALGKLPSNRSQAWSWPGKDILGHAYDFVLEPLPGEISARKIVLPFRSDWAERMHIRPGDLVVGRPMGAGCPVPHVLQVIEADYLTGLLYTWVVGPMALREGRVAARLVPGPDPDPQGEKQRGIKEQPRQIDPRSDWAGRAHEVGAYHMIGFEGIAVSSRAALAPEPLDQAPGPGRPGPSWQPVCGARYTFLPGFCMMHLNHTGLLNMAIEKPGGWQVRVEDIRILAGAG